jgi:hypothetical protein
VVKKAINEYTIQEIINNMLDESVDALIPVIATAQYVEGLGWIKSPANGTFPLEKMAWTTGNIDYKGCNTNPTAADGDTNWIIYKYSYTGSDVTMIQMRVGSWTGRAALFI